MAYVVEANVAFVELERIFGANPQEGHARLREFRREHHAAFLRQAIAVLESGRSDSFSQILWRLCQEDSAGLQQMLFTADLLSLDEAAKLLRLSGSKDPGYQTSLVETVRTEIDRMGPGVGQHELMRALELVAKAVDSERLGIMLSKLCEHPDERLRAKVAVLMGLVSRSFPKRVQLLKDVDPRVRANAVETLWGCKDDESKQLLKEASRDDHHRVASNGLVGLHRAGDLAAVVGILQLSREADLQRQLAGIWAIGATGDPRFLTFVHEAMSVRTGRVRFALLNAARKIKKRLEVLEGKGRLEIEILHSEQTAKGRVRIHFAAEREGVGALQQGQLKPTEVVVHDGQLRIDQFYFEERGSETAQAVAFLLPHRVGVTDALATQLVSAMEEAIGGKADGDRWAIAKYRLESGGEADKGIDIAFTSEVETLKSHQLRSAKSAASLEGAVDRVLAGFPQDTERRHLVLVLDPESGADWRPTAKWLDALERSGVYFHVNFCRVMSEEAKENWRDLILKRKGMMRESASVAGLADSLKRIVRSFRPHHYLTYLLGRMIPPEESSTSTRLRLYTELGCGEAEVSWQNKPGAGG